MRPTDLADEASVDRLIAEYLSARDRGVAPPPADWVAAHPAHAADLTAYLANERALGTRLDPLLDPDTPAGPVRPGQVFGKYVLTRRLATGGIAAVWEAEQQGLRRRVAVKVLTAGGSAESAARFHREAEAVAALDHPHIVPIYEVGEVGGMPYFAMKLAASDLRHRLDRYTADPRAAAALLAKVARAVHHAHQHGVLHRDLKPANILLDEAEGGRVSRWWPTSAWPSTPPPAGHPNPPAPDR
jgi:eukaryotic-like serine/threonine-protein kinase